MKESRVAYFDYLRVYAIAIMIISHVSAQNWYVTDVNTFEWQTFNIFDSISRQAVPIFVMISGSLFLEKSIQLKKLYKKNIFQIYFIW